MMKLGFRICYRRELGISAMTSRTEVPSERIAAFCVRWSITKLALFGSVLRDDFGPNSDIDVLAEFGKEGRHTLFDMDWKVEELKDIIGRDVDLVSWRTVERSPNYLRRRAILQSAEVLYGP